MNFDEISLEQTERIISATINGGLLYDWPEQAKKWKRRWEFTKLDGAPFLVYRQERIGWYTAKKDITAAWKQVYPSDRAAWDEISTGIFKSDLEQHGWACMMLRVNIDTKLVSCLLTNMDGKQIGINIGLRFPRKHDLKRSYTDAVLASRLVRYPDGVGRTDTVTDTIKKCNDFLRQQQAGVRDSRDIQLHSQE